jgi:hypothetical protein
VYDERVQTFTRAFIQKPSTMSFIDDVFELRLEDIGEGDEVTFVGDLCVASRPSRARAEGIVLRVGDVAEAFLKSVFFCTEKDLWKSRFEKKV